MRKVMLSIVLLLMSALLMTGCQENLDINPNINSKEWKSILSTGKNTSITIYHDMYDKKADDWLRESYAPSLQKKYNIKVRVEKVSFDEYYEKLRREKKEEVVNGTVDLLIFNRSYFPRLKGAKLLYGPFVNNLNNYHEYQNPDDYEVRYCNGKLNDSYALLFGRDQTFLMYNKELMDSPPGTMTDLLEYLDYTDRMFDYIDPSIKTGRDFINSVMATGLKYSDILSLKSASDVRKKCAVGIRQLKELNKHTPATGASFPISQADLDIEFRAGSVDFSMTKILNHASRGSIMDELPLSATSFAFQSGTTGSAYYAVIPFNAPNKSASMLAADFLISPAMQASKYSVDSWGNLFGIDIERIDENTAAYMRENRLKEADMTAEELLDRRIPEIPDDVSNLFYQVWMEDVKR